MSRIIEESKPKKLPRRTLSLSANWRQESLDDEVELFLDKYVFPLERKSQHETASEHDSGLHSLETTSASSSHNFPSEPQQRRSRVRSRGRLVTVVRITGETSSFRTFSTKYTDKTLKVTRSKTLPSYHKEKLVLTVNGCESNQIF